MATEFAQALVSDDFESAQAHLCPLQGDLLGDERFPFQDASVTGSAGTEPPAELAVGITEPAPDLFVPFEGTENGIQVTGSVDVTFAEDSCITSFSVNRALE